MLCDLSMSKFILTLSVHKSDEIVFEKTILETKPDEIIFAHQFKDIEQSDGQLVVTNKFGKTLCSLRVSDFAGSQSSDTGRPAQKP